MTNVYIDDDEGMLGLRMNGLFFLGMNIRALILLGQTFFNYKLFPSSFSSTSPSSTLYIIMG